MIDVSKSVPVFEDIKRRKEESLKALMQDQNIAQFVHVHRLSKAVVEDGWAELLDYYDDHKQCLGCQGLESCPKVTKGVVRSLVYEEGHIGLDLKYCQYGKKKEQEQLILSHFLYNNVSRSLALHNLNHNQFILNRNKLSDVNKLAIAEILKFVNTPVGKGLFLTGESGSGKTVLMASMMNYLARHGYDVGICHFPTFLLDMKAAFNSNDADSYLKNILDIPYLLIDGLGEENITSWSRDEVLLTILSYRNINNLTTFFTSMFDIEDLNDVYLLRRNDRTEKLRASKIGAKIQSMCNSRHLEKIK